LNEVLLLVLNKLRNIDYVLRILLIKKMAPISKLLKGQEKFR